MNGSTIYTYQGNISNKCKQENHNESKDIEGDGRLRTKEVTDLD